MKYLYWILPFIMILSLFSGCHSVENTQIVATTLPTYEFTVRLCAGTNLTVTPLLTEGVSCLHDYSLQVSQMRAISTAEAVICSGAGLENSFWDMIHQATVIVDGSVNISLLCGEAHTHSHEHEHDHHASSDPHYWLNPQKASILAETICENLCQIFPEYKSTFKANLIPLQQELDEIYQYGKSTLSQLSCRDMITFHDGFAYFAEAFDLHILAAVEEEAGSETSAQKLISLITLVEEHEIPAIFIEKNGSTASASVISAETGVPVYMLDMAITGDSYFTAMYANIQLIKEALG